MKTLKMSLLFISFLLFFITACNAQDSIKNFNLDFEENLNKKELPDDWIKWGTSDYSIQTDTSIKYSGNYSVVINPLPTSEGKSFGSIAYQLPANYDASSITLTGYMKTENVSDGYAGLLLRVDGTSEPIAFDNMHNRGIKGTNDWTQYEITLPFSAEAKKIFVAGLLVGKGKAWFDKFEVFLDGKNITDVAQITKELLKADLDKEFDFGSYIDFKNLTEKQIENLYKVGKVWGFLKYYHPEIGKGNFNWDYELIRILPEVMSKQSSSDVNRILINQIEKLGEVVSRDTVDKVKDIKLTPELDWLNDNDFLGAELSTLLKNLKESKRSEEHYYIGLTSRIKNPIFQNERTYPSMKYTDDGLKLISLFRYWNMIQYYFPYRNLIDENWDDVLKAFIPKIISANDELSYKLTLLELIGKISDTHANIWGNDEILNRFWGVKFAPIEVNIINGKVVVTKVYDEFDEKTDIKLGDIITHINSEATEKLIDEKIKYCPASNLPTKFRDVSRRLLRTNNEFLQLTVQRDETPNNIKINSLDFDQIKYWENKTPSHKILENNIGYIFPGSLKKGEIDSIMSVLANTNGLIIDFRCYPSDFIVFSLGKYLIHRPTEFVKVTVPSIFNPGEFIFNQPLLVGEKRNDNYKNKVVIIINEITQSQAEYTTMALRIAPKAIVLGSTTAGADGNVSTIMLPGNVRTLISGNGIYYPDGTETQRVGIIPDIEMKPTIKGIKNGEDELLDRAIEIIKQQK
ncbi:MAG: peptidase S41 [Ignavibacteriales bacterium]|nr:peptidase S41 [Ignavibacteriales bacterium]